MTTHRRSRVKGLLIVRVEHPTAQQLVPPDPSQVVVDMDDLTLEPVHYWEARTMYVNGYDDIAKHLSPFDVLRGDDISIYVGDTSAIDNDPPNSMASAIWALSGLVGNAAMGTPMPGLPDKPYLVYGAAIILGAPDDQGWDTDAPDWVFQLVDRALLRLVQS